MEINMRPRLLLIMLSLLAASCAVGPDYKRPAIPTPASFRSPEPLAEPQAASFADSKWFEVFQDPELQQLIRTALASNYDLRDAATRIEAAQAALGITRSNQLPNFGA